MSSEFVGTEGLVGRAMAEADRRRAAALNAVPLDEGDLVMTGRGVGKIRQVRGDVAEVSFFDSPGRPQELVEDHPLGGLQRVRLEPGRRCWTRVADQWWPGRICAGNGWEYEVRFPGRTARISAKALYVRWGAKLASPLPDLLARVTGSPAGLDARIGFVSTYLEQVRASRGLIGATSLAAEMYDHQLEVARRVLDDPVGRFLLADEVGLGKTIEALMVVRQTLVDDPTASIRIVCPRSLVQQWTAELRDRIFVRPGNADDFPFARVEVLPQTAASAWSVERRPDLLVVDEAHNVASWAFSTVPGREELWRAAVTLTREVDRTLLLSATPSLHRDETYLALLHLLDPSKHDLADLAGFRRLLAMREDVASDLIGLERTSDDPAFVTIDALEDLLAHLPADAHDLRTEARELADLLAEAGDVSANQAARVEHLRARVAERYRLDARMLRTRRDRTRDRYPVRGRCAGDFAVVENAKALDVARWLDNWRVAILADNGGDSDGAARIVRLFHEQAWSDPSSLNVIAALRAGNLRMEKALKELDLSPAEAVLVRDFRVGPEERHELSAVPDVSEARAVFAAAMAEWIWQDFVARDQLVISTSSAQMGDELLRALRERLRPEEVGAILRARSAEENAADTDRFSDPTPGGCHVLVCDTAAEEGLNLQTAGLLILVDAPLDAGRVEQRVGRIDRHGVPNPVKVIPVVPTVDESGPWSWFEVLRDGYRVFDRSIAAFQIPVAELTTMFERVLYEAGTSGFTAHVDEVGSRLDEAVKEVRRSEVLDASTVTPEGRDLHEAVSSIDREHEAIKAATGRYLEKSLRLYRRHHGGERISYWLENPFPGRAWQTEVDGSLAGEYLVDAVSVDGHMRVASYERAEALRSPATRVLRAGDRLIDAVARMTAEQFDVGRVAAVWRRLPRTPEDRDWVLFGFHFLVDAPYPPVPDDWTPLMTASARRRAQRFLPTAVQTKWVTSDGTLLDPDSDEVFMAEMPFDASSTGGDVGLFGDALRAIDAFLTRSWRDTVTRASQVASAAVDERLQDPRLVRFAKADAAARMGTVTSRTVEEQAQVDREKRMSQWVLQSLESPTAQLDAMSVVVLTTQTAPPVVRSMPHPK